MLHYLRQLSRLRWLGSGHSCDVVIADNGYEYVIQCVPGHYTALHVPMRGESWFVNARVIYWFFVFLAARKRFRLALRGCYIASVCRSVQAKLIMTMIDNNNWDTGLVEGAGVRVICIGNGLRRPEHIRDKCFDCYFALNHLPNHPGLPFRFFAREYYAVGHLKMGLYQERKRKQRVHSPGVDDHAYVLWISQYRLDMTSDHKAGCRCADGEQTAVERLGSGYLADYAARHAFVARIAHASERKGRGECDEREFFEEATGGRATLKEYGDNVWGAYERVDGADLVVGMYSTLLFEALSVGKRVVFFLPGEHSFLMKDLERCLPLERLKPLSVATSDYEAFERKCNDILSLSEDQYFAIVNDLRADVASFDESLLPQEKIRNHVNLLLGTGLETGTDGCDKAVISEPTRETPS